MVVLPHRIANDVLMEVQDSPTLVDVLVIEMDHCQQTSFILGELFFKSFRTNIEETTGTIKIDVNGREEKFAFFPKQLDRYDQVRVYFKNGSNEIDYINNNPDG
jgi:hypothetical protein